MNIIFRNKSTGEKINIQDFYHENKSGNIVQHNLKLWNSIVGKSLIPTPTYTYTELSLDDILLSNDWEIWCDNFWVNEKQIFDLKLILSTLFQYDNQEILNIANKLLAFVRHNEEINRKENFLISVDLANTKCIPTEKQGNQKLYDYSTTYTLSDIDINKMWDNFDKLKPEKTRKFFESLDSNIDVKEINK